MLVWCEKGTYHLSLRDNKVRFEVWKLFDIDILKSKYGSINPK